MSNLIEQIKESEGFNGNAYRDSLGKQTIGYGTLLPLTKYEATLLLEFRLNQKIAKLQHKKPTIKKHSEDVQNAIYEMCYQLGVGGVLSFKKMWRALDKKRYKTASKEALDSLWAKQTPQRAKRIAEVIAKG